MLYIVFIAFKNKKGKLSYKIVSRVLSVALALLLILIGSFNTGHTKRVSSEKAAAVQSSKIASSKRESSEKSSFSKTASEAKNSSNVSSSKSDSNGDISAFKQSVNELASNKGATASVTDDEVKITVNDNTGESNADIANDFIPRIQKIANMCNLSSVPYVYIQTQSGNNVARTTITGAIKVY